MKIAHISDLHLDKTYKRNNYHKTIQLLEYITDNNFDHVIISGDITENAEASAFEIARNLFRKFGLLNSKKLTVTIGNHDIYGGVHLAEDVINYPKKCKATNYEEKVNEFGEYFTETFTSTIRPAGNELFPNVKEFDEFILISINSIAHYSMLKNPLASNGKISEGQLKLLESLFIKDEFKDKHKIVVTHQ
jgi:3',5'-cyclic-AMP phosphodiesterase